MDQEKRRHGISEVMDPMLFEGGRTAREIAGVIAEKLNLDVRTLTNNVHVRMAVLKKRGYRVEKDVEGKVKLIKNEK